MKNFYKIAFLFGVLTVLSSCDPSTKNEEHIVHKESPVQKYITVVNDEKRVQLALERRKEQTQIRKGDYMMLKNNPKDALEFYLPLLEKLPDDIVLYKKIANAYFLLKDWKKSYEFFVKVPLVEMSLQDQENMILSLFYMEESIDRYEELFRLPLSDENREFYQVFAQCYVGVDRCADVLWNYTGTNEKIQLLKKMITDADKVTPDKNYRNLLIAKQFYEYKMYRIAGMIASEIIASNPGYQEAKKVRAFALYELGKYQDARVLLLSYLENNPQDMEIIVRLGEIDTYLGDYVSANLYFNNAILSGYSPKTILERRLAYNYAKIGDAQSMTKVLSYLLQEDDVAEDDFAVAISLVIEQKDLERAHAWSHQGITRFPGSKILTPLYVQALREMGRRQEVERYIQSLPEDLASLPMIQLEKGILLYLDGRIDDAKKIFEELVQYNNELDFAIEADAYIKKIEEYEQEQKQLHEQQEQATYSE